VSNADVPATDLSVPTPATLGGGPDPSGARSEQRGTTVQLREEELIAEKQLVQLGVIRIRRQVVTETRTVEVAVSREEITVERLPVAGAVAHEAEEAPIDQMDPALAERLRALQLGETLRLPIVEEEIVIQKRPMVTQELVIDKRLVEEVRTLSETVRREDVRITHSGDLPLDAQGDQVGAAAGRPGATAAEGEASAVREEPAPPARLQEAGGTVQLREEELRVHKQVVEAGTVQVRTGVVSEPRSVVVKLAREETLVEQLPVERRPADRPVGSGEDVFDIPEYGEQVSVRKRPVVTEEITVGKAVVEEVERVTATVRREEAHVETRGEVGLSGAEPPASPGEC